MRVYAPHKRSGGIMKTIALVLIVGLIALAAILPASAAGQGGNGKMFKTGSAPQDGTGNQNGEQVYQNWGGQNGQQDADGTCIYENCPNDGTPLHDGTGIQYGKNK
jgi:hypothetical protein